MDLLLLPERFRNKIEVVGDCWIWTGCLSRGYGQWQLPGTRRRVGAHRYAYELLVGPIPDGLQLDHVVARGCTSTACCHPIHLEPVTGKVNRARWATTVTHCKFGHEYTEENTYLYERKNGYFERHCRTCRRLDDQARHAAGYRRPSRRRAA